MLSNLVFRTSVSQTSTVEKNFLCRSIKTHYTAFVNLNLPMFLSSDIVKKDCQMMHYQQGKICEILSKIPKTEASSSIFLFVEFILYCCLYC